MDLERRSTVLSFRTSADRAAVQLDDLSRNRESQTKTAMFAAHAPVSLPERLEHVWDEPRLDADARIADLDQETIRRRETHRDGAAGWRELNGIGDDVPDHLL